MAGMVANLVSQYFQAQDTKVRELRDDLLSVGWNFEGGSLQIFLQFNEEDNRVHLEGLDFAKVPENKYDALYKVLNECNDRYIYVKFVLDEENGQINARCDNIIQLDTCGENCYELMVRMLKIVEDAYPSFMKALWT